MNLLDQPREVTVFGLSCRGLRLIASQNAYGSFKTTRQVTATGQPSEASSWTSRITDLEDALPGEIRTGAFEDLQIHLQDLVTAVKLHHFLALRARETLFGAIVHVIDAHVVPQIQMMDSQIFSHLTNRVALT